MSCETAAEFSHRRPFRFDLTATLRRLAFISFGCQTGLRPMHGVTPRLDHDDFRSHFGR